VATLNPAIKASLERVIVDERLAFFRRLSGIRLLLALIAGVFTMLLASSTHELASQIGTAIYVLMALLLFLLPRRFPALGNYAGFGIALVDVPIIGLTEVMQQRALPEPIDVVPSGVGLMIALIMLATLTLQRASVIATAVAGFVVIVIEMRVATLAPIGVMLPLLAIFGTAVGGVVLVSRMRSLVHQSRQRDLLGKYVLGERIGIGGMAEVFDATYSPEGGFERRVAVKRILPSLADRADAVELFRREAELGASLAHPNIVQVLDFGADGRTYFLAMEFVDGTSLDKLIAFGRSAGEQLPLSACTYVAWQLCEALDYIHQRRTPSGVPMALVHRDINPPNVLVSRNGEVKLADFGIARAVDSESSTRTGAVRGKLAYMSPEQLRAEPYDARADLFALGATLYEVFTGVRLFTGNSDVAIIKALLEQPVGAPSMVRPGLPASLDALVLGLLERELNRRTVAALNVREVLWTLPRPVVDLAEGRKELAAWVARVRAVPVAPLMPAAPAPPKLPADAATREVVSR
jgi:hypothetical protein